MRISNFARSADWIKTEYNNQSSPGAFASIGGVQANTGSLPIVTLNVAAGTKINGGNEHLCSASATSPGGLTIGGIQFYIDNIAVGAVADSFGCSTFNATTLPVGNHTLTAKATDSAGQIGISSGVAVTVNNAVPTSVAVSPANGLDVAGTSRAFTFTLNFASAALASAVTDVVIDVDSTLQALGSCFWNVTTASTPYLTLWQNGGATSTFAGGQVSNSQCTIYQSGFSVTVSGSQIAVKATISFASTYVGVKNVFISTNGTGGYQTATLDHLAFQQAPGVTYTIPPLPTVGTVSPANGSGQVNVAQTFTFTASDALGTANIAGIHVNFDAAFSPAYIGTCYFEVFSSSQVVLKGDDGQWSTPNSRCSVPGALVSAVNSTTLSFAVTVLFSANYTGTKNIYELVYDGYGQPSGWGASLGAWTTGGPTGSVTVTPVAYSDGLNSTNTPQTFTVSYFDSVGATDIVQGALDFSAYASTDSGSCQVQWDSAKNLTLLNGGPGNSTVIRGVFGTALAVALTNPACTIDALHSSFTASGYLVTVNLVVSFSSSFTTQFGVTHSLWWKNTGGANPSNTMGYRTFGAMTNVNITSPSPNQNIAAGTVTVTGTATAALGVSIAHVDLYLDGALHVASTTQITANQYDLTLNATSLTGAHSITAIATDSIGNQVSSSAIAIVVGGTLSGYNRIMPGDPNQGPALDFGPIPNDGMAKTFNNVAICSGSADCTKSSCNSSDPNVPAVASEPWSITSHSLKVTASQYATPGIKTITCTNSGLTITFKTAVYDATPLINGVAQSGPLYATGYSGGTYISLYGSNFGVTAPTLVFCPSVTPTGAACSSSDIQYDPGSVWVNPTPLPGQDQLNVFIWALAGASATSYDVQLNAATDMAGRAFLQDSSAGNSAQSNRKGQVGISQKTSAQITQDTTVVSGKPANNPTVVSVGQQILLNGTVLNLPTGLQIQSQAWTVAGNRIANYTQSLQTTLAPTPFSDPGTPAVTFYWIDAGDNNVTYTATLTDGSQVVATALFRVVRPSPATLTGMTTTGIPAINVSDQGQFAPGVIALNFGYNPEAGLSPGITYTISVSTTFGGTFALVQLVNFTNTLTATNGSIDVHASNAFVVDDGGNGIPQYNGANGIATIAPMAKDAAWSLIDIPTVGIKGALQSVSANQQFQTYLMYQPPGSNSIWVTLQLMTWNWAGVANNVAGTWTVNPTASSFTPNPVGSDNTTLPTWRDYATNVP